MSGKPSYESVKEFRYLLDGMFNSRSEVERLERETARCREELEKKQEVYGTCRAALLELMEKIDIKSSGNSGWEGRFTWFLLELHRQWKDELNETRSVAEEI